MTTAIHWDADAAAWRVGGYHLCREVLYGRGWSSAPRAADQTRRMYDRLGVVDSPIELMMLSLDPPDHSRVRGSIRDVFTPSYVAQMAEGVEMITRALLEDLEPGVPFEFMTAFAQPFPIAVIAELLALDTGTTETLWKEAGPLIRMLDGVLVDGGDLADGAAAFTSLITDFLPIAAARRDDPGDDLFSLLATDPGLELDEVVVNAILLAVSGHETTANLLGNSMIRLYCDGLAPRLADVGVAPTDSRVIGELLRLDSPVQLVGRAALERHDLGGVVVAPGDRVMLDIGAANRDRNVFDEPDTFRLDREGAPPHLAFGHGRHRCLGAALAELEMRTALGLLAALSPAPAGTPTRRPTEVITGPDQVPMVLGKGIGQ